MEGSMRRSGIVLARLSEPPNLTCFGFRYHCFDIYNSAQNR